MEPDFVTILRQIVDARALIAMILIPLAISVYIAFKDAQQDARKKKESYDAHYDQLLDDVRAE